MRIESVTLSGFRCFGSDPITVPISSEITAVVGPNAAGKTALLHALSKLFGVSRAQRTVQRSDFHLGADDDPEDREPKDMFIDVLIGLPELADGTATPETIAPSFHFTDARAFMDALSFAKAGPVVRSAIEFMILTSARPGNIRFMEWSDVFTEEAVWQVPGEKMKMDESHPVPLPPRATEILRAMKAFRSPGANRVFPGDKPQRPMFENTLCKAIRDMGYEATAHGFRSTFKDWSRAAHYPDVLSEFQLAHVDENETRKAYGRDGQLALRREMMEHWANTLAGHVPMPKHEQVPMAA